MEQYRVTLTEGGRIVIPAALRKIMNVKVGDEMTIGQDGGKIFLSTRMMALQNLQKRIGKKLTSVDDFIASRRLEAKRDFKKHKGVKRGK